MVHLYAANISDLPDPKEYPEIMAGLWEDRVSKALRCALPRGRKQSAGGALLLKKVLSLHGISLCQLLYGKNGKPSIPGFSFNLSHSEDMVVCATADKAVGCDIEKISDLREKVAKRFFTAGELEYLMGFNLEARRKEFYRLWTMKESFIKMTGEGLSLPLNSFEVDIGDESLVYRSGNVCPCNIREYELADYCLSVCTEDSQFAEKIQFLDFTAL